ncbi:MAG: hypothetical protein ABIF85_04780 [Nanoarchaeota archaeon]|nr:hypothetical protein [Nanoarchaeota archaeon]MBU4299927.1 hypothetical protein [Nanoarchaeota archaeon]MBU4451375.1 hypothetical protein [Nanoarchaeota archaeon]MCG2724582.1 hypothetical protein [archaeon]
MSLPKHWIPVHKELCQELKPLTDKIEQYVDCEQLYLFKNIRDNLSLGIDHYARMKKISGKIPQKLYASLLREGYDFVFLVQTAKPIQYYIIKPEQSFDELSTSKIASEKTAGPKVITSFSSPFKEGNGKYITEEFLSPTKGWNPVYSEQQNIRKHYEMWVTSFGELMGTVHKNDIIYNDDFWKHLYFNLLDKDSKLIDFGNSYISETEELKEEELWNVHSFLKQMFPEKGYQVIELFNEAYE